MDEQLNISEIERLKLEIAPKINRINAKYGMDFNDIADYLEITAAVIYKWKDQSSFPRDNQVKSYMEKLENLEFGLQTGKESLGGKKIDQREDHVITELENYYPKRLVSIYFDDDDETQSYTEDIREIGTFTEINGKTAFIAQENISAKWGEADGDIYIHDEGMEPSIKRGSKIVIKKINKTVSEIRPGFTYCIIDSNYQILLRKLYIENDTTVKLVSQSEIKFPNFNLRLDQILVIFRVVKAINFNP